MSSRTISDQVPHFDADLTVAQLEELARDLAPTGLIDTSMTFDGEHYVRRTLHRGPHVEIAAIWFAKGQTSTVHDHRGSHCVVRVLRGRVLESTFTRDGAGQLTPLAHTTIVEGQVSGLDGWTIHHVVNLDEAGSVLLNVYSPPFAT